MNKEKEKEKEIEQMDCEIAELLVAAGYRPAAEVRAETAFEFAQAIKLQPRDWVHSYQIGAIILSDKDVDDIAASFGKEEKE